MKIVKLWLLIYIITSVIFILLFYLEPKYENTLLFELLKGNILGALFFAWIIQKILK